MKFVIGNIVKIHKSWLTNKLNVHDIGYIEKMYFNSEIYVDNLSIIHEVEDDNTVNKAIIKYSDCIQIVADVIASNILVPSIPLKYLSTPDESELIKYKLQEGDINRKVAI